MTGDRVGGKPRIFLSHTVVDQALAEAVQVTVKDLLGESVVVASSSSRGTEGSIRSGENWFDWISEQVRQAQVTLVLLTPSSVMKPWILWESGAVYGAASANGAHSVTRVRPLAVGVDLADVPSPLKDSHAQITLGDRRADVLAFFQQLIEELAEGSTALVRAGQRLAPAVDNWLDLVQSALRKSPLLASEAVVGEWCARLDGLEAAGRPSEVAHLHDWLLIAFGQEAGSGEVPIDIRIHRRLGELYLRSAQYEKAERQFAMAHRLVPRDLFILRSRGQAALEKGAFDTAATVIKQIEELDPRAFVHNPECAALKGRYHRDQGDHLIARDVYGLALEANPNSYYLADLTGQEKLATGDPKGAAETYRQALTIIDRQAEKNVWTHATAATAAIVIADTDRVAQELDAIRRLHPSESELSSILEGIERIRNALGLDHTQAVVWQTLLRGRAVAD